MKITTKFIENEEGEAMVRIESDAPVSLVMKGPGFTSSAPARTQHDVLSSDFRICTLELEFSPKQEASGWQA